MVAPVIDMEEELIALFGEDEDFEDDNSEAAECPRGWGPSIMAAEGPYFPFPAPGLLVPPKVIEELSTRLDNLEYGHGQLVQRVIQGSDAKIAAGDGISDDSGRWWVRADWCTDGAGSTTVTEMSSRESSLMQCILGLDKRLAALEKRPP
ncbi:hypothetical protein Tco_0393686 [Tanacetum coccineum]